MIKNEEIVCGITISMIFKNEILYKDWFFRIKKV
jgi:hypothetical protein